MKNFRSIWTILIPVYIVAFLFSCNDFQKNNSHQQTPDASIVEGKKLAATYCTSCHQLPDPPMLDAKSWERGVLRQMEPRLGIFYFGYRRHPSDVGVYEFGIS